MARRRRGRVDTAPLRPSLWDVLRTVALSAVGAPPQTFFYGGQAVIEGVLMRGPRHYAIAARNPQGRIVICREVLTSRVYTSGLWRLPLFRGVAGLVETIHLGYRAIQWSANIQLGEEIELTPRMMRITVGASIAFALLLFIGGPALGASLIHSGGQRTLTAILIEGVLRAAILVGYLLLIGMMPSMKRLFSYHGGEHKAINALEHGDPLDVAAVRRASRLHPRCGTGFLVLVALVSIIVFAPLAPLILPVRLVVQVLLVPLVAAVAYEAIRGLAKIRHTLVGRVLLTPVLATQLLSTREPDGSQIEVAIAALNAAREGDEPVGEGHDAIVDRGRD